MKYKISYITHTTLNIRHYTYDMEDDSKPLILVDSSYFSIKRATALMSWWSKAFPLDPKGATLPWVLNVVYMEKYLKLFKKNIDNIAKKFGVSHHNILFARDCPIDQIWRREIFPSYKGSRCQELVPVSVLTPTTSDNEIGLGLYMDVSQMSEAWQHLDKELIGMDMLGYGPVVKHNNDTFLKSGYVKCLRIDKAEADDICAIIAIRVRELQPTRKIVIVANDRDYLQLVDENLIVVDIPNFKPLTHNKGDLSSHEALLHKIIAGDSSDDIPSCGTSDAKKYACNPALLQNLLESDSIFREKFDFNSALIDFRKIPQDIQETIWEQFLEIAPAFKDLKSSNVKSVPKPKQELKIIRKQPLKIIPIKRVF